LFQEILTVNKFIRIAKIVMYSVGILLVMAAPAMAQTKDPLISFSGAFGAGLVTIGGAYGIGKLASSALDGMARQPEVAGNIQTAMIIAAALIEGFTFFALVICFFSKA
jgi:F-type H+-transporting ATPase subunit c